jgi:membrane protein DedA with SNARE-associated domain
VIWMDPAQLLTALREFSGDLITGYGVWGVAVAMMLESAGVPFVSTAVLLTAGGMILSGRADFWALLCASTAGIIAGSLISYFVGYLGCSVGRAVGHFINRNFTKNSDRRFSAPAFISKILPFMERYGTYSIFIGQLWGVTRTFISFPAGAMQMNLPLFILFTTLGGAAFSLWIIGWSFLLTGAAGLLFKLLKAFHDLTPWLWLILPVIAFSIVYLYRRKGWKIPFASLLARLKK